MKRIGGLKQQVGAGIVDLTIDGLTPAQQIEASYSRVRELETKREQLLPELITLLEKEEIHITTFDKLNDSDKDEMRDFYFENIYPLLTPQAVDSAHPFPFYLKPFR